jgi:protein TonB
MFEQASIDTRGMLRSPWAITVSVVGQALLLSAGIVVSLLQTDTLPRGFAITRVAAPWIRQKPAEPSVGSAVARPIRTGPHLLFVVPTKITDLQPHSSADSMSLFRFDDPVGIDSMGIAGSGSIGIGVPIGGVDSIRLPPPPPAPAPQVRPAAPARSGPVNVSKGVQEAKLVRQVKPAYPPLARQARISGTVRLVAIIGRDGSIRNLQVTDGHPLLTGAAVEAVKQWLYRPTLLNEQPVEVITQIDVNFTLSN